MTLQKVKGFLEPDPNDGDGKIAEGKGSKSRTSFDIEIQKAASYDLTKISLFDEKKNGGFCKNEQKNHLFGHNFLEKQANQKAGKCFVPIRL